MNCRNCRKRKKNKSYFITSKTTQLLPGSRLPCSVFCICLLTEQEVVTPYTRRNFVNDTSTARKGLFDWFFLQKRHFMYTIPVQKQGTGRKMGKKPPKKVFFFCPSSQLAEFLPKRAGSFGEKSSLVPNELVHLRTNRVWTQASWLI